MLDDPSLCYQYLGRLTGKLENTRCPEVGFEEIAIDLLQARLSTATQAWVFTGGLC